MANQTKIQQIKTQLVQLRATLQKYGDLFNEDGFINTKEQVQLDKMQETIDRAEAKLIKISQKGNKKSKGSGSAATPEGDNPSGVRRAIKTNLKVDKDKVTVTTFEAKTEGTKVILTPKKPNGKTIYFFFGYVLGNKTDMKMRSNETSNLEDDVIDAAERGFKVIYDKSGTSAEFEAALYDSKCYGIYWSGHGSGNGVIQTSDGGSISPSSFDGNKVSSSIQFLILASCKSGEGKERWERLIKKSSKAAEVEGWVENTTVSETNDFTSQRILDGAFSHHGTNPDKELDDYIDKAEKAK